MDCESVGRQDRLLGKLRTITAGGTGTRGDSPLIGETPCLLACLVDRSALAWFSLSQGMTTGANWPP